MLRWIKLALSVCIGVVCALTWATPARAEGMVGTHVAYGDRIQQIAILNMIKSKGPPANWPVTIMVDMGWSTAEIQELADATAGLNPYIRVKGIQHGTPMDAITQLATALKGVNWPQGKRVLIFGNELNNLDREWLNTDDTPGQAGAKYAQMYAAFASVIGGSYDMAAQSADVYNSRWGFREFTNAAAGAYANANVLAANAYDVTNGKSADGDPWPGLGAANLLSSVVGAKGRTFLPEYGPDPRASLKAHLDFYKTHTSPGGAENATTLVPNSCDGEPGFGTGTDDWLFYIRLADGTHHIYDESGIEIVPGEDGGCDTKMPATVLKGIDDLLYTSQAGAAKDLAARYTLSCAPTYYVTTSIVGDNEGPLEDGQIAGYDTVHQYCATKNGPGMNLDPNCFFDPVTKKLIIGSTDSTLKYNEIDTGIIPVADVSKDGDVVSTGVGKTGLKFPLYRYGKGIRPPTTRTESFESFFGATTPQSKVKSTTSQASVYVSPVRKLQTDEQNCHQTLEYLEAAREMCKGVNQARFRKGNVIKDPEGPCAINAKLPSGKTVLETLAAVEAYRASNYPLNPEAFCKNAIADKKLAVDFGDVQPYAFGAFKKAYLVYFNPTTMRTSFYTEKNREVLEGDDHHVFYRLTNKINNLTREDPPIHIVPVLVPTGMTSTIKDSPVVGKVNYDGPLTRFMNILWTKDQKDIREQEKAKQIYDIRHEMYTENCQMSGGLKLSWYEFKFTFPNLICKNPRDNEGPFRQVGTLRKALQDLLTTRINSGIQAGELSDVQKGVYNGKTYDYCEMPAEQAYNLTSPTNAYANSLVYENGMELRAKTRVRGNDSPSMAIRGFLLLPEDYRNVKMFEQDFLSTLLTRQYAQSLGATGSADPAEPTAPATSSELSNDPKNLFSKISKYIRASGLTLQLSGSSDNSAESHIYRFRPPNPLPPEPTPYPDRFNTVASDITQENHRTDFNPLIPGGYLARGIFEVTAHILSTKGGPNYEEFYCGLESYWRGGRCAKTIAQQLNLTEGQADACMELWLDPAEAQTKGAELKELLRQQEARWSNSFKNVPGDQYLYASIPECGGEPCYQHIIDRAVGTVVNGKALNPYTAIAIAMNETGGLRSARPDRWGRHFGCGWSEAAQMIVDGPIDVKLQCMLGALSEYRSQGLDNKAALKRYGYTDSGQDLITLSSMINRGYDASCKQ